MRLQVLSTVVIKTVTYKLRLFWRTAFKLLTVPTIYKWSTREGLFIIGNLVGTGIFSMISSTLITDGSHVLKL